MTTKSTNKLSKKVKTLIADLESIILIQEKYIDKIEDLCWFHYDRHIQGWKDNQLWQQVSEYQDKQLEEVIKKYYEVSTELIMTKPKNKKNKKGKKQYE